MRSRSPAAPSALELAQPRLPHLPSLLQFLEGLAASNTRSWYLHNKPQHEILQQEFIALINAIGAGVRAHDPALAPFDAAKAVYRIQRDTRFSGDKSPYKTHMGGVIGTRNVDDKSRPIYWFQIDHLAQLRISAGIYLPSPAVLKRIRDHIVLKPLSLSAALADRRLQACFGGLSTADRLTRPPKGYPADAPHIELIMNRHFFCETVIDLNVVTVEDLAATISEHCNAALPLMTWLRKATA